MTHSEILGLLSVLIILYGSTNYIYTVFRGGTRPHAFSWLIWGVLNTVGFTAQVTQGAGAGSWTGGLASTTCFTIFLVALFKGERNISRSDWITLCVALSAIPLWVLTKTPTWSVILICMINTLGLFPTIRKSWAKPYEESTGAYTLLSLCHLFALLAIEHYTISTWLYPAVLVLSNGGLATFLVLRRRRVLQYSLSPSTLSAQV